LLNHSNLGGITRFEFDRLILEIVNFYQTTGYEQATITLERNSEYDKKIGISGEKVIVGDDVGIRIKKVEEGSFAHSIGLNKDDIITTFNGKKIVENNIDHVAESMTALRQGQSVLFEINRGSKKILVEGVYIPTQLFGFKLNIDIESLEKLSNAMEQLANNIKRYRQRMGTIAPRGDPYRVSAATRNMRALRREPKPPSSGN